jgi:chemotaxis signal transduction protein
MSDALVSCAVGGVEYALHAAEILAVMRAERMRPVSSSDAGIGVVMVGADRASVFPLGATLGVASAADEAARRDRHIVVLRGSDAPVGWLVDRVGRSHLPSARVLPLPSIVGSRVRRWFSGVLTSDDRTMLLLSPASSDPGHVDVTGLRDGVGAATPAPTAGGAPLVVTFAAEALPRCGASRYAISARRIAGLESALHVATLPGSEPPIIGVSVWRGEVLPVVDFRAGRLHRTVDRRRLLIVRSGGAMSGTSLAIPVDAETALHQPTAEDRLLSPPATMPGGHGFVTGLFDVRGQRVALVDPDALLAGLQSAAHERRGA